MDGRKFKEYEDLSKTSDISVIGKKLEALHDDIKPLTTDKGYKNVLAGRAYFMNLQGCSENHFIMQVKDITLTKRFYDKEENKAGFDYEAKVKLVSNKDKKEQIETVNGYIGLVKENGKWKVYAYKLLKIPEAFIPKR